MTKENKIHIKELISSYYTIKDIKRYIILVGLISTVNKQNI